MAASDGRTVIVGIDGSEASLRAVQLGVALLDRPRDVVITTVVEPSDPTLVMGSGVAGGVMSAQELEEVDDARLTEAHRDLDDVEQALDFDNAETLVLRGDPAPSLCRLASERGARAIVMGSRGRGGIKRALLGSVSDFVLRNAPCPVVITRPPD
jgi:nucleotide-binding universal stress UspA family protein